MVSSFNWIRQIAGNSLSGVGDERDVVSFDRTFHPCKHINGVCLCNAYLRFVSKIMNFFRGTENSASVFMFILGRILDLECDRTGSFLSKRAA